MTSFHTVTDRLKNNKAVAIFPEGQVNHSSSSLLSFKSGATLMAHAADAPILPVYIVKSQKWYQRRVVLIGEKINVRELIGDRPTMTELQNASEYIQKKESELAEIYEKRFSKSDSAKKKEKA